MEQGVGLDLNPQGPLLKSASPRSALPLSHNLPKQHFTWGPRVQTHELVGALHTIV